MTRLLSIQRIDARRDDPLAAISDLRRRLSPQGNVVSEASRQKTIELFGEPLSPVQVVERICGAVREQGLTAVLDYVRKLDGASLTRETLRVSPEELKTAHSQASADLLNTVRRVRERIARFQEAIRPSDVRIDDVGGGYLAQRYRPLARVGICVPGGAAAYPSTVLMTAVPAQVAGVPEIVVMAPPTKYGSYNADILAVCHELGISEVYRLGGAHGVAALAYGVEGVPRVDKVVGPGNLFVALAKRHVFGEVDIDSVAGPSEIVVIADGTTRADFTAADLIAQAEHAPGASILITWDERFAEDVTAELSRQLERADRGAMAQRSLEEFGALIQCADARQAASISNAIAPEHLHVATADAEALLESLTNAGAIFLGNYSPVALGDYVAGPSHVLPTSGTARFASGLTVADFLRGNSIIRGTEQGLRSLANDIRALAEKEGLTAHWESVRVRTQ